MGSPVQDLDWSKLQSFAAVAEHGSLSAAARALGGSQPTMSRHISTLEEDLGIRLFERTSEGLVLTSIGVELFEQAALMNAAAGQFSLLASGRSQNLKGSIRITASESFAIYALPEILAELRRSEPEIQIELVASDQTENLLKREADIAVRMYRPTQNDVFTRKVGELHLGMFASEAYLARAGVPKTLKDIMQHDVIGLDRSDEMIGGFKEAGLKVDRDFFAFRCDNNVVNVEMIRRGLGIGIIAVPLGRADATLRHLFPDAVRPTLPLWLTAHSELKSSLRVRRVYDFLADRLEKQYGDGKS